MKFLLLIVFGVVSTLGEDSQVLKDFAIENIQYIDELYKELVKVHSANFLICPLSVQAVFALVNGGARGNTSQQITSSLHLPEGEDKIRDTFLRLAESLQVNDQYTLSSANKIYVAKNFNISNEYKKIATNVFSSEIQNIDFSKTSQAASEINEWVEGKTYSKIKDLVNEDVLNADTVAVLINALYFQGKWVKEFGDITMMPFYVHKRKAIFTSMMKISDNFNYYESPTLNAKFLEVPYEGNDISMNFVLPNDVEGLSTLESRIADVLVAPKYNLELVEIFIPKFKIEATTYLIPILKALGITDAFSASADFSGIGENHDPLSISEVIQKAFIEVDEKGTTAAAATIITTSRSAYEDDFSFIADHPFLFYLKHRVDGVFFIGRYSAPESVTT